jgi:hypothetical protein
MRIPTSEHYVFPTHLAVKEVYSFSPHRKYMQLVEWNRARELPPMRPIRPHSFESVICRVALNDVLSLMYLQIAAVLYHIFVKQEYIRTTRATVTSLEIWLLRILSDELVHSDLPPILKLAVSRRIIHLVHPKPPMPIETLSVEFYVHLSYVVASLQQKTGLEVKC